MSITTPGNQSGKVTLKVFNILVALAFIALCAVLVAHYLYAPDRSAKTDSSKKQAGKTSPAGKYLDITFYSSSAKKSWVNEMVKTFNDSRQTVKGETIRVKAYHVNSGDSLDDLKDGKIKPDLWSPGDESWLELAAAHWRNVKQKQLFEEYKPLVNIPLVIAVWEPMAKALGYPKPIGWKDIATVAVNPRGWAALGHPEWGKFRWGHAHPDANSGFLTIVSEVYASLGKTEGITPEDLKNPQVISSLKEFEGAVEHYGLSNTWIDDLMHSKGPAYLSAAVQYENTIIESNEKHKNLPFKLVAVYPKEGAFWTRHPVAVMEEEWMTPEKTEASKKFIDFLLSKPAQRRAMELGLRPIDKSFELASPFDEAHGVDPKVTTDKVFQVPEEGVLKRIRDLWEDVKIPATTVLILDRSGSMKGKPMENAKEGAIHFIHSMKPRDQVEVIIFNNTITVLTELCSIKDCGENAVSRLEGVFAEGGTALHDVVLSSYTQLLARQKQNPNRRYGIVVLTDGKDTSSKVNRYDLMDALPKGEDFDVPKIYTIAYGSEADRDLLAEISNRTNARLFSSSAETIASTYKELSANF
jgi:Ca-activated chloride channel family protein